MGTHEWWILLGGGVAAVSAIARLLRGDSGPRPHHGQLRGVPARLEWSETNQPNTGPSQGDQIVGELCTLCERSIMLATEAKRCATCRDLIHKRCAKDHALLHVPKRPPYR